MMAERTTLIAARREAEDNLVKMVIQLSAALLTVLAGFISQAEIHLNLGSLLLFTVALASLAAAIISGLAEHRFSSKAYLQQQKLLEDYFQKNISTFEEPTANRAVRKAQAGAFISFVMALICLGIFAFVEALENHVTAGHTSSAATSSSPATATSAAATSPAASPATAATADTVRRRAESRGAKIRGTIDATTTAEKR